MTVLANEPLGSFMVRKSETQPGRVGHGAISLTQYLKRCSFSSNIFLGQPVDCSQSTKIMDWEPFAHHYFAIMFPHYSANQTVLQLKKENSAQS